MAEINVFEQIKAVMTKELNRDFSHITQEMTFKEINLDSLDLVQLIMAIEETFGIEINDEEAEGLKSMADAVDFVERKICMKR